MNKLSILIIGKNGFLGKNITRTCQLSKINYFSFSRENWEHFLKHDPSKWLKDNGVKTIIFAAGFSKRFKAFEIDSIEEPGILSKCLSFNLKLVYLSSSLVYGKQKEENLRSLNENLICYPTGEYGLYKKIIEDFVLSHNSQNCVLRLSSCIGKEKSSGLLKVINEKVTQTSGNLIEMMHANTTRDYLYIENASKMIIEIAMNKDCAGIFNIGSGRGHSVDYIIREFEKFYNLKPKKIKFGEQMEEDPLKHVLNMSKTNNFLNKNLQKEIFEQDQIKLYLSKNKK